MKKTITLIAATLAINVLALPAYACSITPLGDMRLRMEAILNAFDQMETLQEFKNTNSDVYEVLTYNHHTLQSVKRTYILSNTSPMCPQYEAREIQ